MKRSWFIKAARACRCLKQDIPEVEAVIAALTPRLETWWTDAIEAVLRRGDLLLGIESLLANELRDVQSLVGNTPDGRSREQIEAELVSLMMMQIETAVGALPASLLDDLEEARDSLLTDAALSLSLSLTVERIRVLEQALGPVRAAALADMQTLLRSRFTTRREEVRTALTRLARSARSVPVLLDGAGAADSARSLRESLREILGAANPRQWVAVAVDQWSYRWFNIGLFMAARDDGHVLFRVTNNPPRGPDSKTTQFCRWVHGRLLDVQAIESQIKRHVVATLAGDAARVYQNWPMLDREQASDTSAGAEARFALLFPRVGLPPYHIRCRTVAHPVRLPLR